MNLSAIYHRATEPYCYALDEEILIVQIQTGHDVKDVKVVCGDPFEGGILGGNWTWEGQQIDQVGVKTLAHHKWWTFKLTPPFKRCKYYFKLISQNETMFLLEDGFMSSFEFEHQTSLKQFFTFPWLNPSDVNKTPQWVEDTIWYQIFPDRFASKDNPHTNLKKWHHGKVTNFEVYGGNLKGITDKLDYLQNLGINGLYLTPIFKAGAIHKYDTIDYYEVDPMFGSTQDLQELVKQAHQRNIRVMLDGVFNHTSRLFFAWEDILKHGKDSKYYDWYFINQFPFSDHLPTKKGDYFSFAFADNMPKLNTNHPDVIAYLLDVTKYWIETFDIDGLRLDVANELSHQFNKQLRRLTKQMKPDFFILGEIWHDALPWLRGDEFDSVMNYPLTNAIQNFWLNQQMTARVLATHIDTCFIQYMAQTSRVLFNLLDSHDTQRLINLVAFDSSVFLAQLTLLMAMPGTPSLYYGTEIALEGGHDPDCRRCMPWDQLKDPGKQTIYAFVSKLILLRKQHIALRSLDLVFEDSIHDRLITLNKYSDHESIRILINATTEFVDYQPINCLLSHQFQDQLISPGGIVIDLIR